MALLMVLQLLTLWPLCHADITRADSQPKPWLGVQPAAVVTPGVNVTLRCQAPQSASKFILFKPGAVTALQNVSGEVAEFLLEEVTPAQGGSYHCCYQRPGWGHGVWSQPSDALELLVTDLLPAPSLEALPGPVVAPGANVSLRCAGSRAGMSFALYREDSREPLLYGLSALPWVDFPLPADHAPGTYTCYYHTPSPPYVLSSRSPKLVVSSADSGTLDYTRGNLIRLGLAGLVLLSLVTLVVSDWRSRRRVPGRRRPEAPRAPRTACRRLWQETLEAADPSAAPSGGCTALGSPAAGAFVPRGSGVFHPGLPTKAVEVKSS